MSTPSDLPDEELVPRIADGDAHALTTLFRRRRAEVYRFALHMTASPASADDVTQEVFLTLIHDAGRYQAGRASVIAWLLGIARNHVRQRLARDRALCTVADLDEASRPLTASATASDPQSDLAHAEQIDLLRRAVLSLPVAYREVVVLCELEERPYAEAATALGCAVGTVRSRLHRARALLVQKLGGASPAREASPAAGTRCIA